MAHVNLPLLPDERVNTDCVAFVIHLSRNDSVVRGDIEPLFLIIPRTSLMASVLQHVREAFLPYVAMVSPQQLAVWLKFDETPVPWQMAAGLAFDAISAITAGNRSDSAGQPVRLEARVVLRSLLDNNSLLGVALVTAGTCDATAGSGAAGAEGAAGGGSSATMSPEDAIADPLLLDNLRAQTKKDIRVLGKQMIKGCLAGNFSDIRSFVKVSPADVDLLVEALLAADAAQLASILPSYVQAITRTKPLFVGSPSHRLTVVVCDTRKGIDIALMATVLVSIPTADLVLSNGVATVGSLLHAIIQRRPSLFQTAGGRAGGAEHVDPLAAITGLDTPQGVEAVEAHLQRAGCQCLISGVALPLEMPLSVVLPRLLGFDFRLHVVITRR